MKPSSRRSCLRTPIPLCDKGFKFRHAFGQVGYSALKAVEPFPQREQFGCNGGRVSAVRRDYETPLALDGRRDAPRLKMRDGATCHCPRNTVRVCEFRQRRQCRTHFELAISDTPLQSFDHWPVCGLVAVDVRQCPALTLFNFAKPSAQHLVDSLHTVCHSYCVTQCAQFITHQGGTDV